MPWESESGLPIATSISPKQPSISAQRFFLDGRNCSNLSVPRSPRALESLLVRKEAEANVLAFIPRAMMSSDPTPGDALQLNEVIPWGRSFDEYRRMFALSEAD